jgi:hypothetical protein
VSGNGSVLGVIGECIENVCPTTTTTTTVLPCVLTEYLLVNQALNNQEYQYTNCSNKLPIYGLINSYQSLIVCSTTVPIGFNPLLQITPTGNFCS